MSFSLSSWLQNPGYTNGTIEDELQCYGLPYGGIGFVSHVFTYYTVFCLAKQRSPWWPFRTNAHRTLSLILSITTLLISTILTTFTMIRCHNRWELITIAIWKMLLSLTLGFISLHSAVYIKKDDIPQETKTDSLVAWTFLYTPGLFIGFSGLISLVAHDFKLNHNVRVATCLFCIVIILFILLALFGFFVDRAEVEKKKLQAMESKPEMEKEEDIGQLENGDDEEDVVGKDNKNAYPEPLIPLVPFTLFLIPFFIVIFGVFYCDWGLAALGDNIGGVPSGEVAPVYYAYFITQCLPFFCM